MIGTRTASTLRAARAIAAGAPIADERAATEHAPPAEAARAAPASRRRLGLRLDGFELLLLGLLAAASMWTLGLEVWQSSIHHLIWTGTDAVYQQDAMQQIMWIQGILAHGASPDLYVLSHTTPDYFQPLVALSAGIAALGVPPYITLLLWKPVAVLAIFLAARAYVNRTVSGKWPRRAALTLALFFAWGQVIGDSYIVFWSWGYPFALISLACALGAVITYSADRKSGRLGWRPILLAGLASWLHPWQGETLILLLAGCELTTILQGQAARLRALAVTVGAGALPLLYFFLLVQLDPVWARERERALTTYSLTHVAEAMAPIVIAALIAYRRWPRDFLSLSTRVWPLVTVVIFALSEWQGSGPTHALLGVSIPLAVLAVEGIRSLPWRRLRAPAPIGFAAALAAVLALTVPGAIRTLRVAYRATTPKPTRSDYVTPPVSEALAYLRNDPQQGGVLTRFYMGMLIPPQTGRRTYVGNCYWSEPDCEGRSASTQKLLEGGLTPAAARALVSSSGARFVLAGCGAANLETVLAPLTTSVHRFSCATVYVVRAGSHQPRSS